MNEAHLEDSSSLLSSLLKSPDDLDKLASLKSDFTRKKSAIDSQLRLGLQEQLSITQNGMTNITDGQRHVNAIRDEMMKIDKLCAESQGMIKEFPEINRTSVMQRNFAAVESMLEAVRSFRERLEEIEMLLGEDDGDLENQPNLLAIHEGLTSLRDIRDQAVDQVSKDASDSSGSELIENLPLDGSSTMRDYFTKLDEVVDWFDEHVGTACLNIIDLIQAGNNGLVVRLALVIEEEENKDKQVKALQDAQREFGDVAMRFKSINVGTRPLREYKKKFLQAVSATAEAKFEGVKEAFDDDPDKLEKGCRWFFNDLNTVKLGLVDLVPPKWKIFKTYSNIYHKLMHDFLIARLDSKELTPVHMLAVLNWAPKYYSKMGRLGIHSPETELKPHIIDDRETDLVREYRNLITKAVEEWMDRLSRSDRQAFTNRAEGSLDQDADGRLHTKSMGDMWTMLREQLAVAQQSGRPDVVEGVVDSMLRALKSRQQMWERLLDDEVRRLETAAERDITSLEGMGVSSLQEWLAAIANDQITNIDDNPDTGSTSFLTRFRREFEPLVTPAYTSTSSMELESITNGYVDLATHCMSLFASLIFTTDFRDAVKTFFTPTWYQNQTMRQITTTFEDYLQGENNYTEVLHPSLRDILVEELSDALLVRYLGAVRNKGVKFRRSDPFTDKFKDDIQTLFSFFSQYPDAFVLIKEKWRAVSYFEALVSTDKSGVASAFENMKAQYWDVQIGWVESVVRARDDSDRSMVSNVKSVAAAWSGERGGETVMGKIR